MGALSHLAHIACFVGSWREDWIEIITVVESQNSLKINDFLKYKIQSMSLLRVSMKRIMFTRDILCAWS